MTNGIRKVRKGVDIFKKRILDSCKFISDSTTEYRLFYINLFLEAGSVSRGYRAHIPICIILYNYSIACQLSNSYFFKVFYPTMCYKNFNEIVTFEKGKYVLNFSKISTYLTSTKFPQKTLLLNGPQLL